MNRSVSLASLLICSLASTALAGPQDVSPALRERAKAICLQDVFRLCSDAMTDETTVVACMLPKRSLVSMPCQRIYDDLTKTVQR